MRRSEFTALTNAERWDLLIDEGVVEVVEDDAVLRNKESEDRPYEDWSKDDLHAELTARKEASPDDFADVSFNKRTTRDELITHLRDDDAESLGR